jgi:predicted nucleic acid-binding protein
MTTAATHTPGPWTHKPRSRDGHVDIICKGHAEFAYVGCPRAERPILDYAHENEQTANARLIAAAPDLLEACLALVTHLEELPEDTEKCRHLKLALNNRAGDMIHAAIAKARGE